MSESDNKHTDQHIVWRIITRIVGTVSGIIVAITAVTLFLTVIFRYFLHMPLGWTDELSRLLFMWVTFLGAAVCAGQERHTRFELFMKSLKPAPRAILDIAASVLILIITGVFIYAGFKGSDLISIERFVILDITYTTGYLALPIAAILIFLYYCRHLYAKIQRLLIVRRKGGLPDKQNHAPH